MTICSLVQDFSTPSMGGKGESGVERETWMKIPLWTLASQRLRFSKLSMTSGDHRSPQRYHYLINSQSRLIIFFLLYHPICQMQLNYDLLSSWVQSGGKHNGTAQQERWCSKDTAGRFLPRCNAEWKPKPTTKCSGAERHSCRVTEPSTRSHMPQCMGSSGVCSHIKPEEQP